MSADFTFKDVFYHISKKVANSLLYQQLLYYDFFAAASDAEFIQVGVRYVLYLKEAISLGGWGIIGHWVTRYEALVFLYHVSYSQSHTLRTSY